jgi:thiamine-phosphate pyrophosphorylase
MTSKRIQLPHRFVLTDASRDIEPSQQIANLNQADALIYRHYELPAYERLALARALRSTCKAKGIRFLVAGDFRLACEVHADGLHLPAWVTKQGRVWRQTVQPGWIVTAAAHSQVEVRQAASVGADAVLVSPVFATGSHPGAQTLGVLRLSQLARSTKTPIFALGGVASTSVERLRDVPNLEGWATVSAP